MKAERKRAILIAFLAIFVVSLSISCQKESQEFASTAASRSSGILKEVGDDYWKYMLEESIYLRMKHGLKIHKLPDVSFSYAKSQSDFASSILERLAAELEGAMTFGYYDPPSASRPEGIYYYNGSNLSERSLLMAEGLVYHELVPGHHFHIALQSENEELPNFRRETLHNAFNEGWAEYAAWLGLEMGLYLDPYSLCGKYMMDMFLSTRLVVDTGMNYFEWPHSQAVKFMKDNLLESEIQIHSETLRYSTDIPGQALGYKLGSLKMFEFRNKAEKALKNKFDIRRFHDAILGSGSMPLLILEEHINWFIEKELGSSKE